jgi:cytoskeletal protein RodZ
LLYIFVIVCSVNGLSQSLTQNIKAKENDNEPSLQASADISARKTPTKIIKVRQLVNSASNENDPVQVRIIVNSQAWIRVVADGKTKFEGVLTQGSQRDWEATEELTVKTNNAGAVLMKVNQEEPKQMGKPGKSGEIRIASKNLQL